MDQVPFTGNSHQADLAEGRSVGGEDRLEDLFRPAVDAAHDGHAAEDHLAQIEQRAADQVGGQEAEQRQAGERDDEPDPGIWKGR